MSSNAVTRSNAAEPAVGVRCVFLRTGRATRQGARGNRGVRAARRRQGAAPAAVRRRQEKLFLVVEGQVVFFVGCDRIEVAAGGTAYAPAASPPLRERRPDASEGDHRGEAGLLQVPPGAMTAERKELTATSSALRARNHHASPQENQKGRIMYRRIGILFTVFSVGVVGRAQDCLCYRHGQADL